jgi:hypothetical protein
MDNLHFGEGHEGLEFIGKNSGRWTWNETKEKKGQL